MLILNIYSANITFHQLSEWLRHAVCERNIAIAPWGDAFRSLFFTRPQRFAPWLHSTCAAVDLQQDRGMFGGTHQVTLHSFCICKTEHATNMQLVVRDTTPDLVYNNSYQ